MRAEWRVGDRVRLSPDGVFSFTHYGASFESTGRTERDWAAAQGSIVALAPKHRLIAVRFEWGVEQLNEQFLEPVGEQVANADQSS